MEKKRGWWALAGMMAVTLALLLGGYAGAYYALVTCRLDVAPTGGVARLPHYSARMNGVATRFFAPMHRMDRVLRPNAWRVATGNAVGMPPLPSSP